MQDYMLLENSSGYLLLETGGKLVLDIVGISFNNYQQVTVGDGMSVSEKVR